MSLVKIFGDFYIISFDGIDKIVEHDPDFKPTKIDDEDEIKTFNYDTKGKEFLVEKVVKKETYRKPKEIDGPKFEILRYLLETLSIYNEETDEALGIEKGLEKAPIPFKIAFNTLLYYKILKKINIS
jgi:hypothetical protein